MRGTRKRMRLRALPPRPPSRPRGWLRTVKASVTIPENLARRRFDLTDAPGAPLPSIVVPDARVEHDIGLQPNCFRACVDAAWRACPSTSSAPHSLGLLRPAPPAATPPRHRAA